MELEKMVQIRRNMSHPSQIVVLYCKLEMSSGLLSTLYIANELYHFKTYRKSLRVVGICAFLPHAFRAKYNRLLKSALLSPKIAFQVMDTLFRNAGDVIVHLHSGLGATGVGTDFTSRLPIPLYIDEGWVVKLIDLQMEYTSEPELTNIYICSNICENSIVASYSLPLLYHLQIQKKTVAPTETIRIKVIPGEIRNIRLYALGNTTLASGMSLPPVEKSVSSCTLLFSKL